MKKFKLEKKEEKVSLNIKISKETNERLKRARKVARLRGGMFNVSDHVEDYLTTKLLVEVEKVMGLKSIEEEEALVSKLNKEAEDTLKEVEKKVEI